MKDKLSEPLHYYTKGWSNSFDLDKIRQFSKQNMSSYKYQYHFENNILKAVKSGSEFLLKETVEHFSNSIVPIISGDELRSEKTTPSLFMIVSHRLPSKQDLISKQLIEHEIVL